MIPQPGAAPYPNGATARWQLVELAVENIRAYARPSGISFLSDVRRSLPNDKSSPYRHRANSGIAPFGPRTRCHPKGGQ
jgi:hypothetical protein